MELVQKGFGRKRLCPNFKYYPGIFLKGVEITTKYLLTKI
jgi:hypothetical protein